MSLPNVEQIILDHIQANRNIREFWQGKIAEWRTEGKSEDEVAQALADNLHLIYMGDESAREDLEGLIDYVSLMTANYSSVAFALLGRDLRTEAVAEMIKAPPGWPEPYYVGRDGKKLGPYSYAQIRVKWADEEITSEDKVYHEPSKQWRPLRELAEPWTAEGFVPQNLTASPAIAPDTKNAAQEQYSLWSHGAQLGPFSADQIREMWHKGTINSAYKYWNASRNEYFPITDLVGDQQHKTASPSSKHERLKGTKERPIRIATDKSVLAIAQATFEIDELLGKGNWELRFTSNYQNGCQCWTIKTPSNPFDEVWIASPGLAPVKVPGGGPDLYANLSNDEVLLYRKIIEDGLRQGQMERTEAAAIAAAKPDKNEASTFTNCAGCGCGLLGLVGLAILVFASSTETRIWTVVVGVILSIVFGALSQYFDNRKKKRTETKNL